MADAQLLIAVRGLGVLALDIGPDVPRSGAVDSFVRDALQGQVAVGGELLDVDSITMKVGDL